MTVGDTDKYKSFLELIAHEKLGTNYAITVERRESNVAIVAPHGGYIEFATSEISRQLAGGDHSLYLFEGLVQGRPFRDLHVTSSNFDDPACVQLVADKKLVIGVHGRRGDHEGIEIGGRHREFRKKILKAVVAAGFPAKIVKKGEEFSGRGRMNICNRGLSGRGIQFEFTAALRRRLLRDQLAMTELVTAIRSAIEAKGLSGPSTAPSS